MIFISSAALSKIRCAAGTCHSVLTKRCTFRSHAKVAVDSVDRCSSAGKLFQVSGPETAKFHYYIWLSAALLFDECISNTQISPNLFDLVFVLVWCVHLISYVPFSFSLISIWIREFTGWLLLGSWVLNDCRSAIKYVMWNVRASVFDCHYRPIHGDVKLDSNCNGIYVSDVSQLPATALLSELRWLPVTFRITFKLACLAYKLLTTGERAYLRSVRATTPLHYTHTRTLQSTNQLFLDVLRFFTEFGKKSFSYLAATVWEGLPLNIRLSPALLSDECISNTQISPNLFGLVFVLIS